MDIQKVIDFYDIHKLGPVPTILEVSEIEDLYLTKCPNCKEVLKEVAYFIEDKSDFISTVAPEIGEELSKEIAGCQSCNSDIIPYTQIYGDPSDLENAGSLLEENGFSVWTGNSKDELASVILENLYCSTCNSSFSDDDPYVTEWEKSNWYGDFQEEKEILDKVFNISEDEANSFIEHLINYPMLALHHKIGQKIYDSIKYNELDLTKILKPEIVFYRGRTRKKRERLATFIPEELWNPPKALSSQGRFNFAGVSTLYLADNLQILRDELSLDDEEESMDVAEFKILKPLRIFDLTGNNSSLFSNMSPESPRDIIKREYVFPNFIAQCLMILGYNGIGYDSVKGEGKNYCFFSFTKNHDITIERVISHQEIEQILLF